MPTKKRSSKKVVRKAGAQKSRPAVKSRPLPVFHVDAFTSRVFHGNPAAVVLLDGMWLADEVMQAIAAEHNLPMTAFVRWGKRERFGLRWFSATREYELCGHATLAAANVMWTHDGVKGKSLTFETASGDVPVTRDGDRYTLSFAAVQAKKSQVSDSLCAALGREPVEVYQAKTILAVFENKRDVHELEPDMSRLAALDARGVIVTAPGAGHDFVSRFFGPQIGFPEDAVTGSAHCTLVPYWAERLGKKHLTAHQVSRRGGELWCELKGSRVLLGGHAVTFSKGTIQIWRPSVRLQKDRLAVHRIAFAGDAGQDFLGDSLRREAGGGREDLGREDGSQHGRFDRARGDGEGTNAHGLAFARAALDHDVERGLARGVREEAGERIGCAQG